MKKFIVKVMENHWAEYEIMAEDAEDAEERFEHDGTLIDDSLEFSSINKDFQPIIEEAPKAEGEAGKEEDENADLPPLDKDVERQIDHMDRHIVETILEGVGIQCYEKETLAELRTALKVNVRDGTIPVETLEDQ